MGVVNVTPDSFSDGGQWLEPEQAVAHGLELVEQGADLVDIGGESTRPGAQRPPVEEELRRVLPVVHRLSDAGAVVSIDTMRAEVAVAAVEAGAQLVNDVSGGLGDPAMLATVADLEVPYVLMHWRGHSDRMQQRAEYADVVADVVSELRPRLEAALDAGIDSARVVLDPGLGFAKTAEHNWALLANLDAMHALGRPVLLAASRKRFLGRLLGDADNTRDPSSLDAASAAVSTLAAAAGVWCVRVHVVPAVVDAVRVVARLAAEPARPAAR
ncbi:MAG: dihydropteroate synthase [Nocardioidaceae bacterium]